MRRIATTSAAAADHIAPGDGVEVCVKDGLPTQLIWNRRAYRVTAVVNTWRVDGRWWLDLLMAGTRRRYYRLSLLSPTSQTLCVEIYRQDNDWKIWRVLD